MYGIINNYEFTICMDILCDKLMKFHLYDSMELIDSTIDLYIDESNVDDLYTCKLCDTLVISSTLYHSLTDVVFCETISVLDLSNNKPFYENKGNNPLNVLINLKKLYLDNVNLNLLSGLNCCGFMNYRGQGIL